VRRGRKRELFVPCSSFLKVSCEMNICFTHFSFLFRIFFFFLLSVGREHRRKQWLQIMQIISIMQIHVKVFLSQKLYSTRFFFDRYEGSRNLPKVSSFSLYVLILLSSITTCFFLFLNLIRFTFGD